MSSNVLTVMIQLLYLVGGRRGGKSIIGRMLAKQLDFDSCNTDERICETTGCSVSKYVEFRGWQQFREVEINILASCTLMQKTVVAIDS